MVWIMSSVMIIILGVGFLFWRKSLTRASRSAIAGLSLAICAILWLFVFSPDTVMKLPVKDAPSLSQPQKKVTAPATEATAPATPASQPVPGRTTAKAPVVKTPPGGASQTTAQVSETVATAGPETTAVKLSDEQLDTLIGDALPIKPRGSTMVNTVVKRGDIQAAGPDSLSEDDYSFPEVIERPDGMWMIIPDEPLPSISSRRPITTTEGEVPGPGDVVALTYDMFSWSTGEMVESSQTALKGPLMYRLGGRDTPIGIPRYLDEAIHNRPYGSTVQVVFEKGMADLPGYMNPEDGYVLVVRVDQPDTDSETALENMVNAFNQ